MARWKRIESCFDARGSLQVGLCYHKGHTGRRFFEYAHLEAPADNQRHFKRSGTSIDVNADGPGRWLGPFRRPRSRWPISSAPRWTARGTRDTQLSVSERFRYTRRGWLKKVVKREQKVGNLMLIVGKSTSLVVRLARLSQRINLGSPTSGIRSVIS